MFDLAYPLEETVEIDGVEYPLNMSFDNILRLIDLQNDNEVPGIQQIELGLEMLIGTDLGDIPIEQKEEILYQLFKNAVGDGEEDHQSVDIDGNPMPQKKEKEVYSLKEDAEAIFASFYQDYGVDLFEMQGKLHWRKFKAMLSGLRPDTKFKEIVGIRTMEPPTGKGMEQERKRIKELQRIYALKGDEINDIEDD